jgi:hypothetical protein
MQKVQQMSIWPVVEASSLNRASLEALFANEIAAIRVPDFVPTDVCARSVAAIEEHGFSFYRNVDPPIGRIGVTQTEHRTARDDYLEKARGANEARARLFSTTPDPLVLVIEALSRAWRGGAEVAREHDGRSYFAGIVRIIGEALIHCDWAPHDSDGWVIGAASAQLSWNIYYAVSEAGGETTVFERPWSSEVEAYKNIGNYGYSPAAVDGCGFQRIAPVEGDLIIFNSQNMHCVDRSFGERERITASSFIGRMPSDRLVLWS